MEREPFVTAAARRRRISTAADATACGVRLVEVAETLRSVACDERVLMRRRATAALEVPADEARPR